jgi:exoribonuclease R
MHLCGVIDRGAKGWGDNHVCLSSKFVYSQEHKHQSSFSSGLPDLAQLDAAYQESDDGFVISRLIGWSARQPWPIVHVTHVLSHLPLQNQLFLSLAVAHGIDVPLPLTANPSDMFPFEQRELLESATASQLAIDANDRGRVDMRDAIVFTIDSDATVDLDDAMHCRRRENGSYEVRAFNPPPPTPPPFSVGI